MHRRLMWLAAPLVTAGLAASGSVGWAAEPYTVDVILPLTGPGALLGTTEHKALERFEATYANSRPIGGRTLHFAFHDDQSSPQTSVQLANEIVAKKPAVMLGSALVAMCNATTPLMRRGPVEYCFSPGIRPAPGGFVFSGSIGTKDLGASLLRFLGMKGWTKIALITSTDASGQDAARNMHELFALPENKGLTLVSEQTFNPSDISAAAQIERIKGAGPQAVIAWSTGAAVGVVFKAIHDAGLDVPVATTDGNQTYATMERFAAILPATLFIPSPSWMKSDKIADDPAVTAAKDAFFAAFVGTDVKPDNAASLAWDPALLVLGALEKLGPEATAEQVRSYFAGLKGFVGTKGVYDFVAVPQRGLGEDNVVITEWDKAKQIWAVASKARGVPF